ncbi:sensor histidine kinase [Clostridium oryzae]|uniref:histidine kinase n=1 Tax=Clostridium oryzae TaxID=1450648 RepID=A0A1V4IHC7_9CLOT|nr:sensor histidine kinase [Clostridium oryzae]OPJ59402.1 sensor histidine kinase LiaS [Clostridium oryzae]
MNNKFHSLFTINTNETGLSKSPVIIAFVLIYFAIVLMQPSNKLPSHTIAGFTIVLFLQLFLYIFSDKIFKHRHWLYFFVHGIIIFDYAVIGSKGYEAILLGLIPLFIFQSILVYNNAIKVILTSAFFYSIFCITVVTSSGTKGLIQYLPILIIITIAVRAYSTIFLEQVDLRIKTQKILKELELAYDKVEELTLINERQRMARDLHDTLSQGLAGIIMQLEAVNANLKINNTKRAQEIVLKAMKHARKTLADSRMVISDLRFKTETNIDFAKAIENEINGFKVISNVLLSTKINIQSEISINTLKHILYIVREALNNIAKHAKAKNAILEINEINNIINIKVSDDGIGFDINILDKLFGHYGIQGITERVKAINGEIKIITKRKHGTNLEITIPIEKGTDSQNE